MARFTAQQIYAFARGAGFSPDQSATMTAIALAESGGYSRAHNPVGEDSRGLWQINARAHPDLAARFNLYDPNQNARAAYEVSRHGHDVSPWTTTHGGTSAKYLRFRTEAEAAARANGDGSGRGVWTGTSAYGDPLSAGPGGGTGAGDNIESESSADTFLRVALAQRGDPYEWGATASLTDANPDEFDCSELTLWAAGQAGVTIPDTAAAQYLWAKEHGYLVPVAKGEQTPGALLFHFSSEPTPGGGRPYEAHVAIGIGDGKTIEARGEEDGVNEFESSGRFEYAAVIPGLAGGNPNSTETPAGLDSDLDDLPDVQERRLGLDPASPDTDRDGVADGFEVNTSHTDARLAFTDADTLSDAFEISHGLDPNDPDTNDDGILDGAFARAAMATSSLDEAQDVTDADFAHLTFQDDSVDDMNVHGHPADLEYYSHSALPASSETPFADHDHADDLTDDV